MTDEVIPSGIPGLDVLLGGGFPRRQTIVVTGEPGWGKTILCSQIAFSFAARGMPVVVATVTSEPHDKLVSALRDFRFFDRRAAGRRDLLRQRLSVAEEGRQRGARHALSAVRERGAKLLFIDGLRSHPRPVAERVDAARIPLRSERRPQRRRLHRPLLDRVSARSACSSCRRRPPSTASSRCRCSRTARAAFAAPRCTSCAAAPHMAGAHVALIDERRRDHRPAAGERGQASEPRHAADAAHVVRAAELDALLRGGLPRTRRR